MMQPRTTPSNAFGNASGTRTHAPTAGRALRRYDTRGSGRRTQQPRHEKLGGHGYPSDTGG